MRYLMILEVSQKQAYIFASTKLRENIVNSAAICQVTDPDYFESAAQKNGLAFSKEKNLVYGGGGHTVLEFDDEQEAKIFAWALSGTVKREFPEMELFIRIIRYDEDKSPAENMECLAKALEEKKAVRKASFHQGTFGVEKMDAALRRPVVEVQTGERIYWKGEKEYVPSGYQTPWKLEDLGNSRDESSFVAVVHIDGNAMGKRVERIRAEFGSFETNKDAGKTEGRSGSFENADAEKIQAESGDLRNDGNGAGEDLRKKKEQQWNKFKKAMQVFSESIDRDFKAAYREMSDRIAQNIEDGKLGELDLSENYFPVRKIILAGDDVCFVTEGRIGLEAARLFLEALSGKKNELDGGGYAACAGIAIFHQKYPFYKAYEFSEMLCSNAKKYLASCAKDAGTDSCAIDWHIAFGEAQDTLADARKQYTTMDGCRMELRPYILSANDALWEKERVRRYENFRKLILKMQSEEIAYAKGKLKEFREALREGKKAAEYYLKSNLMDEFTVEGYADIFADLQYEKLFTGEGQEGGLFVRTSDGTERSLYFDAIEMLDTFLPLE